MIQHFTKLGKLCLVLALAAAGAASAGAKDITLLNVSYYPTRELYVDVKAAFVKQWEQQHPGDKLTINQ